ncbi:DUF6919 domain-containing protein [Streptomyces sp. NPDC021100]|uniref:DUF6919 domain-containing protein n=1 Tax=Streptomyces sp. NPDC021100 TaxID=3365114 RepID=UPI0037A44633
MRIRLPWMSRADRAHWRSARTLDDLGQLVALWLEGTITSQTGYQPGYGPDEETTELIPVLAAANRAGFVTDCSQPGCDETVDGRRWQQRAAVSGLITDTALLTDLVQAAEQAGLITILHGIRPGAHRHSVIVTTCDGEPITGFGGHLSRTDLKTIWPDISRSAFSEVTQATQLTLIEPAYGPDDQLWKTLHQVVTVRDHDAPCLLARLDELTRRLNAAEALFPGITHLTPGETTHLLVYEASHDGRRLGLYTNRHAARDHGERLVYREGTTPSATTSVDWIPDDGSPTAAEELSVFGPGTEDEDATGYVVTPLILLPTHAHEEEGEAR